MPWTINYKGTQNRFEKTLSGLSRAEQDKYDRWLEQIPEHGPFDAADIEHLRCSPLSDFYCHVYVGAVARVFFTVAGSEVTLEKVGHTR